MVIVSPKDNKLEIAVWSVTPFFYIVNFMVIAKSKGQQARKRCVECYIFLYIVNFMVTAQLKEEEKKKSSGQKLSATTNTRISRIFVANK